MSDEAEALEVPGGRSVAGIARSERVRDGAVITAGMSVVAAVVAMASAAVQALSFQLTNPVPVSGNSVSYVGSRPPVSFSDRLNIFGTTGANLPVALLLVIAAAALMTARQFGHEGAHRRGFDRVAAVAGVVAATLVLADVVLAVTVVVNSDLFFYSYDASSRAAGVIGLLSPAVLGAGVVWCSWRLVRSLPSGAAGAGESGTGGSANRPS